MVKESCNLNQTNINLSLQIIEHKKTTTYDVGNPSPGLGQAHNCASVTRLMGSQPSFLVNWISKSDTDLNKR